jgi:hypothetical protein
MVLGVALAGHRSELLTAADSQTRLDAPRVRPYEIVILGMKGCQRRGQEDRDRPKRFGAGKLPAPCNNTYYASMIATISKDLGSTITI